MEYHGYENSYLVYKLNIILKCHQKYYVHGIFLYQLNIHITSLRHNMLIFIQFHIICTY